MPQPIGGSITTTRFRLEKLSVLSSSGTLQRQESSVPRHVGTGAEMSEPHRHRRKSPYISAVVATFRTCRVSLNPRSISFHAEFVALRCYVLKLVKPEYRHCDKKLSRLLFDFGGWGHTVSAEPGGHTSCYYYTKAELCDRCCLSVCLSVCHSLCMWAG